MPNGTGNFRNFQISRKKDNLERWTKIFETNFRKISVPFDFEPEFPEILIEWKAPEFYLQFNFHSNQSHFRKNSLALRLTLKQRHKGTQKWPIKPALDFNALERLVLKNKIISNLDFIYGFYEMS